MMLSYLDTARASQIISVLPEESQPQIIVRLAKMEESDPEVVLEMERALTESLGAIATGKKMKKVGGIKFVAEILNSIDSVHEKSIMETISDQDFDLATTIKELMFVFDDIVLLDDKSIQTLMKDVENDDLIMAIKGSNDDVKEKILRNVSKRQAETIEDELSFMGPVKMSTVAVSQQKIISVIRKLDEEGKILIQGKGGADEIVQ